MTSEISINFYLSDLDSSDFIAIRSDRHNPDSEVAHALIRKVDKNIFVQTTIISYDREDLKNDTL